jgi:hypothetical protein
MRWKFISIPVGHLISVLLLPPLLAMLTTSNRVMAVIYYTWYYGTQYGIYPHASYYNVDHTRAFGETAPLVATVQWAIMIAGYVWVSRTWRWPTAIAGYVVFWVAAMCLTHLVFRMFGFHFAPDGL